MAKLFHSYNTSKTYRQRSHTLLRVLSVIKSKGISPPIGWSLYKGIDTAIDIFIGYLMLDAWIANQDRHHANWGLIVTLENENMNIHLAPTVDHASGLGRNETDNNIKDRLKTRDQGRSMARYVERALSAFYNSPLDNKPMSTLEAFFRAAKRRPLAARSWLERLANLTPQDTLAIFANVPPGEITPVAVDFAQEILNLNQQRLLRLETDLQ